MVFHRAPPRSVKRAVGAQLDIEPQRLAVALDRQVHHITDAEPAARGHEVARRADGLAVRGGDDVARLHPGLVRAGAVDDGIDLERGAAADGDGRDGDAEGRRPAELTVGDDVVYDEAGAPHRDGEAKPLNGGLAFVAAGAGHFQRVDADHLPAGIDERAAGVAVVERGVRLQEGHGLALDLNLAVDGGDDAVRKRPAQLHAEGVADGIDRVAHAAQV